VIDDDTGVEATDRARVAHDAVRGRDDRSAPDLDLDVDPSARQDRAGLLVLERAEAARDDALCRPRE
jgi:hypothetical protein